MWKKATLFATPKTNSSTHTILEVSVYSLLMSTLGFEPTRPSSFARRVTEVSADLTSFSFMPSHVTYAQEFISRMCFQHWSIHTLLGIFIEVNFRGPSVISSSLNAHVRAHMFPCRILP